MSTTRIQLAFAIAGSVLLGAVAVLVVIAFVGGDGGTAPEAAASASASDDASGLRPPFIPSSSPGPSAGPSGSASPGPSGAAAPGRPGGGARIPAGVVNLTNWKLTLPVAKAGSSKAQEILQPQLANYAISPYFTVNGSGDGIVFQAQAGGATTSGSGYPRSELREMTGNGAQEASWSTTSGTSTMTLRAAITHLTTVKPQVTVAQVHDSSDDVLVVRLDGPHHLYAEHNGKDYGDLDNNYSLGTPFAVQFVASGGHIRISYNGVPKVDYPISSSGDYFKAGCYTQSNTSKGDAPTAYAEVVIYRLEVAHG